MTLPEVDIDLILSLLVEAYGDRKWKSRLEPVGELVLTILSQNTSDANSRHAFESLLSAFPNWDRLAAASTREIAKAIRSGGLSEAKAKYIGSSLKLIKKKMPDFDLRFLKDMGLEEAREWLLRLPGVGMKTASCVLLFSLGMPAFPVDTHVYRVARRLGLISGGVSVDAAHVEMERLVYPSDVYRCHVLFIEHGRRTCRAQRPLCKSCVLASICPSYKLFADAM